MKIFKKIYRRLRRIWDGILFALKNMSNTGMKVTVMRIILTINPKMYNYKHRVITQFLNERMNDIMQGIKYKTQDGEFNKIIWTMWYQGEENAPNCVKRTLESIKQYAQKNNYQYICLRKETIENYIEIDPIIKQKFQNGEIQIAYFSDIIRLSLLENEGGLDGLYPVS